MIRIWSIFTLCVLALGALAAPPPAQITERYVFTDEKAVITITPPRATVPYAVKTVTVDGWGPTADGTATVQDGKITLAPLGEGLHIVTLQLDKPTEVRFLGIQPPPAVRARAAQQQMPRSAKKLFAGQPYTILAMGDSVTNTGDYEGMLAKMLARATGNAKIKVVDRSYSGRSIDASVRFFADDGPPNKPDLGLIMYGLNDQAGGCALDGFLDQYRWLADRLASDCKADTIFLTPTTDVSVDADFVAYGPYFLRTFGFADALRPLARKLKVPLADTFHAMMGKGAATLDATGKAIWPKHPLGYGSQFSSMLESGGKGDGIHPGALGHLQIARAVFNTMMGIKPPALPLSFTASSTWTAEGLVSQVTVRNTSKTARSGRFELYPVPDSAVTTTSPLTYTLQPGAQTTLTVAWPQVKVPEDLLKYPTNVYFPVHQPIFALMDYCEGGSRLYPVTAPMTVAADFLRTRSVVYGQNVTVHLRDGKNLVATTVAIPNGSQVGRIPLLRAVKQGKQSGWAAAELAYVQYGSARAGEAKVDGVLDEWADHRWSVVGEPVQARWSRGIEDGRTSPRECYLQWAYKAGKDGIYIAMRGSGPITKDNFTLFFDTRAPALLGTPGRYYWVSGSFAEKGALKLGRGETTTANVNFPGTWQQTEKETTLEFMVPYAALELTAWPQAGDLGLSIWWRHTNQDATRNAGHPTNIMWSEDGHPWNTRWYGVVRLDKGDGQPLPYMVRIK